MNKQQIEQKIVAAVKNDPHQKDILKVWLFGSYVYGQPREDSDLDVLVEFRPDAPIGLFEFVRLQRRLSRASGKKVDLLTPAALSKYFRAEVLAKAKTIYEK